MNTKLLFRMWLIAINCFTELIIYKYITYISTTSTISSKEKLYIYIYILPLIKVYKMLLDPFTNIQYVRMPTCLHGLQCVDLNMGRYTYTLSSKGIWGLALTHNIAKDSSSQTVNVHVLQKAVRVLNWRNITWKIFYGGLRQEKQTF